MTARRGVTEEAAVAAIESACRLLRLPTIRSRFAEARRCRPPLVQ